MRYYHPKHQSICLYIEHGAPCIESNSYLVQAIQGKETCCICYSFVVIATDESDAIQRLMSNCREVVSDYKARSEGIVDAQEQTRVLKKMNLIISGQMRFRAIRLMGNRCYPVGAFDDSRDILR